MKKIQNKDMVKIDFIGMIDNIAFEGGTAKNYYLEIGSNTFIGNFEKQLIGHQVNDIIDVKVKFPKKYHDKSLASKDAVFRTTIKYILNTTY